MPHQPDFDVEKYMGRWFEMTRTKDLTFYQKDADCVYIEYFIKPNGKVNVYNT